MFLPFTKDTLGCIKCIKDQHVYFTRTNVLVLYYGHQHVRQLMWPFQNDLFENTNTNMIKIRLHIHYFSYRIIIHHMYLHLTIQIILNSDIFIIIHILFCFSTVNFKRKFYAF